ncbi:LacI family DNA-binding transcriptional regulator [Catelliglobosispora koreensis]|uniref:LacI family DNA-binding transcriptional regulator n=1 Tax=Catelliglobosispora koreensis TaxID=129052 RepID=UPI000475F401|nr:LacI family DNA-binding transcriptional regulator [Catelliglobosispora koreensis]
MTGARRRVTQQDIAKMTGVSQATVSVVLNGRSDSEVKIAPETREKVLRAIAETGYVADPVARRLAARHNKIIGVFTYEPVFPSANSDFYHPFLVGIEQRAESLGCDLLLLTSSPVVEGRRRIFHQDNRIRLADGCVLLGRSLDRDELTRLVADGLPFVSIGRRDAAGGPVPYVGAAYGPAVASLVARAVSLGHTKLAYLGAGAGPESWADRYAGFTAAVETAGVTGSRFALDGTATPSGGSARAGTGHAAVTGGAAGAGNAPVTVAVTGNAAVTGGTAGVGNASGAGNVASVGGTAGAGVSAVLEAVVAQGITAVFAEEHADGVALWLAAEAAGIELSVATLGEPTRDAPPSRVEFSGLRIPRQDMGAQAVEVLTALIEGTRTEIQRLLPCDVVTGETLKERA